MKANLFYCYFEVGDGKFWRRNSPVILVAILSREMPEFDDEPQSRRYFEPGNVQFWRRGPFSSPFLVEKRPNLATRVNLVTIFS